MARTRLIKHTLSKDPDLAKVSISARYLFTHMLFQMDRNGIFPYNVPEIKSAIFLHDESLTFAELNSFIDELIKIDLFYIVPFEEVEYLYCPTIGKHQQFHIKEKERFKIPFDILDKYVSQKYGSSTVQLRYKSGGCVLGLTHEFTRGSVPVSAPVLSSVPAPDPSPVENGSGLPPVGEAGLKKTHPKQLDLVAVKETKQLTQSQELKRIEKEELDKKTQIFIGKYVLAFQKRFGSKARPDLRDKIRGQIRTYLKDVPINVAINRIEVYFQMEDPWFKTKTYDWSTFEGNQTKISLSLVTGSNGGDYAAFLAKE